MVLAVVRTRREQEEDEARGSKRWSIDWRL